MDLAEIFEHLYFGELRQTAIGETDDNLVSEDDYPKLISLVNFSVKALYERFTLLEEETSVQMQEGQTYYNLDYEFALSNDASSEPIKYVIDSVAVPFNRSVFLKVLSIWSEGGTEFVLNPLHTEEELKDEFIAYTPYQDVIQIPISNKENAIYVIYSASAKRIPTSTTDLTTKIKLPEILMIPLLYSIAERYFTTLGGDKKEGAIYSTKYELACNRVKKDDLVNKSLLHGSNQFWRNGWL